MRGLLSTWLLLGLWAGCATTRSAESARGEVLDADRRFWAAVSRGDVDHAVSRFGENAVIEAPDGSLVRGRVALGERVRRDAPERLEVLGLPEHAHVDSPDLVVVTGTAQWTPAAPAAPTSSTVRYLSTWRWTGTGWRLVSADASPPAADSGGSEVVRRVLDAWTSGNWASLQPLLAPGYRARASGGREEGADLRQRFDTFHRTWAKARFDIEEQFATGDRIVTRISATLTENGTGRTLRYSGLDVSRVVDGLVTDHWDVWEPLPSETTPPTGAGKAPAEQPERTERSRAATGASGG